MNDTSAAIGDLITEATGLVERPADDGGPETLALVHDALAAAVADCPDAALASDASEVLAQLARAVRGLERRHDFPLAS